MGFLYGWTFFVVIQTGTIAAVAVAFGRFLGVLWPAITPDATPGSRRPTSASRALGCTDPANAITARAHAAAAGRTAQHRGAHLGQPARRARREARPDDADRREDGRARAAHHPRPHDRPQRDRDRGELRRRPLRGGPWTLGACLVLAFGAAMVGSLFSSDAWNNVTFAAAEVQNPRAICRWRWCWARGSCACSTSSRTSPTSACCRARRPRTARRRSRAASRTRRRIASAPRSRRRSSAPSGGDDHGDRDPDLDVRLQQRADSRRRARATTRWRATACSSAARGRSTRSTFPPFALIVQSVWTALLCLTGTYGQLLNYVIFAALLFYVAHDHGAVHPAREAPGLPSAVSRGRISGASRAVHPAGGGGGGAAAARADRRAPQAVSGLVLVLIGIPVFSLWRRVERTRRRRGPDRPRRSARIPTFHAS